MDVFLKEKYSIKKKLNDHIQSAKQNKSSTDTKANNHHIYTLDHEGFFLRAIQKQIKREGSILKRIKKKIYEFKDAKLKKRNIKNSTSYYMQSMFSPSSIKNYNGQKFKTVEIAVSPSSPLHSPHRQIYSSNTTKRDYSKTKYLSFTVFKDKDFLEEDQTNPLKKYQRSSQKRMEHLQRPNFEQYGMKRQRKSAEENPIAKSTLESMTFSLNGTKPQWSNFECYRNWNTKKKNRFGK